MKRNTKILLNTVLLLVLAAYVIFATMLYKHNERICNEFEVLISDTTIKFITADEIVELLETKNLSPIGKFRSEVAVKLIESEIRKNVYVDSVEVYTDMNGKCLAKLVQKIPIIRISNVNGYDFYLTQKMVVLPPKNEYYHKVAIINGNFKVNFEENFCGRIEKKDIDLEIKLKKLINFVQCVNKNEFARDIVSQIWVDSSWKVELVPTVGNQVIYFGELENVDAKIKKLTKFYQKRFKDGWWENSTIVNLEYNNQIIIQ